MVFPEYHPFKSSELRDEFLKDYDQRAKSWPVLSETKMVDTSYGKTIVRISGPAQAKPLILLHGAGANSLMWLNNVGALSAYFRTFAIDDLYGSGRSINTRKIKDSRDYVNWLNELFNALQLGNDISMMGASYGGWQISQYLLRFPERLHKIVLLAPAYTVLRLPAEALVRFLCPRLLPSRFFGRSLLFWLFEDWARKDKAAVEGMVQIGFLSSRCFKTRRLPFMNVLSDNEWKSITIPTLFMVGENEKIYSARSAVKRLNTVAPQIKTEIIPNAGHDLISVQTELVNKKVLEFLTGP